MGKVKCADCGFFAQRNKISREIVEAEDRFRSHGEMAVKASSNPSHGDPLFGPATEAIYDSFPVCFMRVVDFRKEKPEMEFNLRLRVEVASSERDCVSYTPWKQGFSPKEHFEMNLLDAQRTWQVERDREDKEWRNQQAAQEHQWREQQAAKERQWRLEDHEAAKADARENRIRHWQNIAVGLFVAILSVVATLAAVWLGKLLGE